MAVCLHPWQEHDRRACVGAEIVHDQPLRNSLLCLCDFGLRATKAIQSGGARATWPKQLFLVNPAALMQFLFSSRGNHRGISGWPWLPAALSPMQRSTTTQ